MLRKNRNFKLGRCALRWLPGASIGLVSLLSIATFRLFTIPVAQAEEMTLSAIVTPTITLSMSSNVSENIEPTVDGSFKNIATVARVQVMNSEYYDVSISGNPDMVGTNNPDEKIAAINGEKRANEFSANTWGYNVSKNSSGTTSAMVANASTVYKPVPATSTQVVGKQATTNNAADDYYSLNFGAKVDTSIPADTYTSRVTLSVVASPVLATEYSLTYDGNGATGGTVPAKQTASSYDENYEFTVVGNTGGLTKTGYTFIGWADSADATTAQYAEGSKVTAGEDAPSKIVYAVWKAIPTWNDITNMQEMTTDICKSANPGDTLQLKDTRDNKLYWVTKMADGNCWMVQNLDLDLGTSWPAASLSDYTTASAAYSPVATATTASGSTIDESNTGTRSWSLGDYVYGINPTSPSSCSSGMSNFGDRCTNYVAIGTRVASNDPDFYTKNGASYTTTEYDAHYSGGNRYQWNTATAGTGGTISNGQASGSICPKNWRLPTKDEAANLLTAGSIGANMTKFTSSPYFYFMGGAVHQSSTALYSVGGEGYYWTSTPSGSASAYYLSLRNQSTIDLPGNGATRNYGFSIRCVAR